ncbi:MAG: DegQ family serine endoprotease [Dongiaceae bacterium]
MSFIQRRPMAAGRAFDIRKAGVVALIAGSLIAWTAAPAAAASAPDSFSDLAKKVTPAVVNIQTTQTQSMAEDQPGTPDMPFPPGSPFEEFFKHFGPFGGEGAPEGPMNALGSGFVIDDSGHVVTNNHVVQDADEIQVKFADGREFDAVLLGSDPETDLALLKIESDETLPYVEWGNSDELEVGDWVMAVGNPFGLGGTVTAGIVSARGRDIRSGPYDDFIQTDAAINRGNSGGPMFDLSGNVVGINTAIYSPSGGSVGIGFAIPSTLAQNVVAQLMEDGNVERGWLGVRIQPVSPEIADALGLDDDSGALVAGLLPDSPATGTLRQGDVIVGFDGAPVAEIRDLTRSVAAVPAGKTVNVEIWRDGARETVAVEIGARPGQQMAAVEQGENSATTTPELGLSVAPLDERMREQLALSAQDVGVVVVQVDPSGKGAEHGIARGDVIRAVNGEAVANPSELTAAIEKVDADSVLLLITRDGDDIYVGIDLKA